MKILLDAMNETLRRSLEEMEGDASCDSKKDCNGGSTTEIVVFVAIMGLAAAGLASCICYREPLANCMRNARERVGFNYGAAEYQQANRLPESEHGNNYSAVTEDMHTPRGRNVRLTPSDMEQGGEQDGTELNPMQQQKI